MGLYGDRVLPVLLDMAMSDAEVEQVRARTTAGLHGEVVEVGFGSGLNVPHYPRSVRLVRAIEPASGGRKRAARRIAASPVPVEYVGTDGAALPMADDSIDQVLTTWTLCSIPDVEQALAEITRVLRPGGTLHFAEHGRSPDPRVAGWQDRLTPIQRRLVGGCHLNRPIDELIRGAGLELVELNNFYMHGSKILNYTFQGAATKP